MPRTSAATARNGSTASRIANTAMNVQSAVSCVSSAGCAVTAPAGRFATAVPMSRAVPSVWIVPSIKALIARIAMNAICEPYIREKAIRNFEKGRIVILTSEVATLDPMPFNGLYNISKTALECYAQALRQELNLLGQSVVTVRPGAVATPLAKGSKDSTAALAEKTELYKKQAKHFSSIVEKFTGKPMPPERLAKTIYKASTARHPRYSYSKHRNPGLVLLGILPKRAQCFVIKLLLNRK